MKTFLFVVALLSFTLAFFAVTDYVAAQEAEVPIEPTTAAEAGQLSEPSLTPTDFPTATLTLQPATFTPESIPAETALPSPTPTPESATPTLVASPTPTPLAEQTIGVTPTNTATTLLDPSLTETALDTATTEPQTPTADGSETPTLTGSETPTPLLNESETLSSTPDGGETPGVRPTASETPTLIITATLDVPMVHVQGVARYQNRLPDQSGIQIAVLNGSGVVLSVASTNTEGVYSIAAPVQEFYWLVVQAPLHRRFEIGIWPGETLPEVILAGGDINGDGCVGPSDLALLTTQYELADSTATDITGDGISEADDLAILAGNFDSACEVPTITATPTATPEALLEITPTLEQIMTPEIVATDTIEPSLTPLADTPMPTPETFASPTEAEEITPTATLETLSEGG